jgi:hypothetical protein
MTKLVWLDRKCLEILQKGCLTRYVFNTRPPCPADTIFGWSPETPITLMHFSQGTIMEVFFDNLLMSVSIGKRFTGSF